MWYSFTKLSETEDTIVYAFGYESHERTGRFEYNKKTKELVVLQDSAKETWFKHLRYTVCGLIEINGAPDNDVIAYG